MEAVEYSVRRLAFCSLLPLLCSPLSSALGVGRVIGIPVRHTAAFSSGERRGRYLAVASPSDHSNQRCWEMTRPLPCGNVGPLNSDRSCEFGKRRGPHLTVRRSSEVFTSGPSSAIQLRLNGGGRMDTQGVQRGCNCTE